MCDSKKTLAAVIGTITGVALVSAAVWLYVKSQEEEPVKNVQDAIGRAFEKVREIEKSILSARPSSNPQ